MNEVSLILTLIPLLGAILVWFIKNPKACAYIGILIAFTVFLISLSTYLVLEKDIKIFQFFYSIEWIPSWNVTLSFGFDYLNAPFVLLTSFIAFVSVFLSIKTIKDKLFSYMALMFLLEAVVLAYFLSTNFLIFFFFYEAMLIPSVLLIYRWGGKNSYSASMKFLIYTFAFSIFLLMAVIGVYVYGGGFEFERLFSMKISYQIKYLMFLGFVLAFAVKIPVFPLHGWLRDAYYEAPMPITIFLSAVLGKMGIYGLLRIIPAFQDILLSASSVLIFICIFSFIYAAFLALSEKDIKAMFAYMSLSHVGIITAAVFTGTSAGYNGALLQSINHGILAAAFFYLAEMLYRHTSSFEIEKFGALSKQTPLLVFFACAYVLAMGGFPGLNYFNGEIMILSGIFLNNMIYGFLSIIGIVTGVMYLAWFFYRVFIRKPAMQLSQYARDVSGIEMLIFLVLLFISIYLGLNPKFILFGLENLFLVWR